ncbi:MAG: xanthine dehydrogenase family protein molybdopterin-binding subunit, partial [Bacteroidetes bacterium]
MKIVKTRYDRRSFLKASALAGGGLMLGFSWLAGCRFSSKEEMLALPEEWFPINNYLKIGDNGLVTIFTPNPEFGQNIMTSMPMIVAEELDVDWKHVLVELAPHDPSRYPNALFGQFTGGSRGIMTKWEPLRVAGASARHMLRQAAAQTWQAPLEEVTTRAGVLIHEKSGREAGYGEMAALAATFPVPEEVPLKEPKDFRIIGHSRKNVVGKEIVTGKPLFTQDYRAEGMLIAMVVHPPAFGLQLKSYDDAAARALPGIVDIFPIETYREGYEKNIFDTNAFPKRLAVVGRSTWEVMQARKALKVDWEPAPARTEEVSAFGRKRTVHIPAGLESSTGHLDKMKEMDARPGRIARRDGDPEGAFARAAKILERTYTCPHLAHNCMEPISVFAEVNGERVKIVGPMQAPGLIEITLADRLGVPPENIELEMPRMGGGFGRRAYSHYAVEAALISRKVQAPVKLVYTREDDMTDGIYRPAYMATYRAAFDASNNLIGFHVKAGGVPESPLFANRFPAGALDHYLAEEWAIDSNITIGAFRAPRSNFIAGAEQSFLDEVAEAMGKDPIELRLEWLERAKNDPVGDNNDYDPERYAGVLRLVREKSNWDNPPAGLSRGVAAYFCHNTYVAHVLDLSLEGERVRVHKVTTAIDCGIVVNPDAARNMAEGAIIDGIGNALFGEMSFHDGAPEKANFDRYRMIRMREAPDEIEVHFVQNDIDPTGMGEPPFPPIFGALANALYRATGRRFYRQPFRLEKQ